MFRKRSLQSAYVSFFPNSSHILLFETPILEKNLKNDIPWHSVRAAIREEQWEKIYKRHLLKVSSHNILSEEETASLLIPPTSMEKKKMYWSTKRQFNFPVQ